MMQRSMFPAMTVIQAIVRSKFERCLIGHLKVRLFARILYRRSFVYLRLLRFWVAPNVVLLCTSRGITLKWLPSR